MCLATHEWQAMIFYKGQAAAWEGCIAAPMVAVLSLLDAGRTRALILGGTRHLTASAKAALLQGLRALKQEHRKSSVVFIRTNMFLDSA